MTEQEANTMEIDSDWERREAELWAAIDDYDDPAEFRAKVDELAAERRRRAMIQMASSLRNLGHPDQCVELMRAERERTSDHLDDAVGCALALGLADLGREREGAVDRRRGPGAAPAALPALDGQLRADAGRWLTQLSQRPARMRAISSSASMSSRSRGRPAACFIASRSGIEAIRTPRPSSSIDSPRSRRSA
jgi:hypothetical protein